MTPPINSDSLSAKNERMEKKRKNENQKLKLTPFPEKETFFVERALPA